MDIVLPVLKIKSIKRCQKSRQNVCRQFTVRYESSVGLKLSAPLISDWYVPLSSLAYVGQLHVLHRKFPKNNTSFICIENGMKIQHENSVAGPAIISSLSKFEINTTLEQKRHLLFCPGPLQPMFCQTQQVWASMLVTEKNGCTKMLLYIFWISLWGHYKQRSF